MKDKQEKFNDIINYLVDTIEKSILKNENSYTYKIINQDLDRITQKLGEEAIEVVIAAGSDKKKELINETADLLYHLLILLKKKNITLDEIADELINRKEK